MKYIKPYKIFESNSWIRDEINDLLAHLIDEGYVVRVSYMGSDSGYVMISPKENQILMKFDDIKDDIIRMVEILDDRYGCSISYKFGTMTSDYRLVSIDDLKRKKEPGIVPVNPIKSNVAGVKINIYSNIGLKKICRGESLNESNNESESIIRDIVSDISDEFAETQVDRFNNFIMLDLIKKEGAENLDVNKFERESGIYLDCVDETAYLYIAKYRDRKEPKKQSPFGYLDNYKQINVETYSTQFYRGEIITDEDVVKFEKIILGMRPQLISNGFDIIRVQYVRKAIYLDIYKIDDLENILNYFTFDEFKLSPIGVNGASEIDDCGKIVDSRKISFPRKIPNI